MKVYIVKNYKFFNSNGHEYQMANCGETGLVFTSRKRAEKYFYKCAEEAGIDKTEINIFPYLNFEYKLLEIRYVFTCQETETI